MHINCLLINYRWSILYLVCMSRIYCTIAIAIIADASQFEKKRREKSFDFPQDVYSEFLIVTFIPLTIREAWQTSTNYSERWKILLQSLCRYADSFAPTRYPVLWGLGTAALFRLASRTLIRTHKRSCRSIDRVTSFRERILLLLGVAVDHNDLAIFLSLTSNIDFYGCEFAYLFPYITQGIKFHR